MLNCLKKNIRFGKRWENSNNSSGKTLKIQQKAPQCSRRPWLLPITTPAAVAIAKPEAEKNMDSLKKLTPWTSAVAPAVVLTQIEAASNVAPPALSIGNGEVPPLPSNPKEKKPAPTTPPVYETAPSNIPNPDAPVTASVALPIGTKPPVSGAA
jgi:hypothetical protein